MRSGAETATLSAMTSPPPVLPRRLRLPPHRSLLLRGPSARLLGLDPRTALVVDDLPPPLARMLDELAAPVERVGLLARAVRRGGDRDAAEELLRRLVDAEVLIDADGPERVARQRAAAAVAVVGGGRIATGAAAGLGLAGVGSVWIEDDSGGTVQQSDLGTGLLDADRGRPRAGAVMDVVRRMAPATSVGPPPARARPDLCVLADAVVPDLQRLAALHRDRVAHLAVRLRDGTGVVGPLVFPGRSACLGCIELHRRRRDPDWPAVTAQLVGQDGRGDAATAAATAALGVAQVLAALDGAAGGGTTAPPSLGATLELDTASGELLRRGWPAHPDCTCGAPPSAQTCAPRHERGTIMR
jgi:bacteriocin biosynthesis cyclodehydratase domain-containing protein